MALIHCASTVTWLIHVVHLSLSYHASSGSTTILRSLTVASPLVAHTHVCVCASPLCIPLNLFFRNTTDMFSVKSIGQGVGVRPYERQGCTAYRRRYVRVLVRELAGAHTCLGVFLCRSERFKSLLCANTHTHVLSLLACLDYQRKWHTPALAGHSLRRR